MTTQSEVIVQESEKGRLTQETIVGTHILWADEPKTQGGNDHGPSPYDFILAGLGACTSMTLRLYADMKKIPLTKVVVRLTIEKIYAVDCENCENSQAKIDHITRTIELHGTLTVEQKAKLLDIANKCPVHRTLTSKISITTALAP
jgi:putative redox protein